MKSSKLADAGWVLLLVGTAIAAAHFREVGGMALTGFLLAYLTKGMRRKKG